MMPRLPAIAAALVLLPLLPAQVLGQTGSEGYFTIFNNTGGNIVVGFYTNDGGGWSSNWLSDALGPDESAQAEFFADSGLCEQVFQVGWLGDDGSEVMDEPTIIDICQASNVYLGDNEMSFD